MWCPDNALTVSRFMHDRPHVGTAYAPQTDCCPSPPQKHGDDEQRAQKQRRGHEGAIPHFVGIHCATTHPIGNNLDNRQEDGRSDQKKCHRPLNTLKCSLTLFSSLFPNQKHDSIPVLSNYKSIAMQIYTARCPITQIMHPTTRNLARGINDHSRTRMSRHTSCPGDDLTFFKRLISLINKHERRRVAAK